MKSSYCLISTENDPTTYEEAIRSGLEWKNAIIN